MYSDKFVKYYDDLYNKKDYVNESQFIESNSNINNLLDIGCGTGKHIESLYKKGRTIHGIDVSGGMIDIAKSKFNDDVLLTKCNVTSYKSDIKFDTIISMFNVVNHILDKKDLELYFKSISELLSDDGTFIFDCFNSDVVDNEPRHTLKEVVSKAVGGRYLIDGTTTFDYDTGYMIMDNNIRVFYLEEEVDSFDYRLEHRIWLSDFLKKMIEKYNMKVEKVVSNSDYDKEATVDDYKITFVCVKYN